jgi:hypothetical protein
VSRVQGRWRKSEHRGWATGRFGGFLTALSTACHGSSLDSQSRVVSTGDEGRDVLGRTATLDRTVVRFLTDEMGVRRGRRRSRHRGMRWADADGHGHDLADDARCCNHDLPDDANAHDFDNAAKFRFGIGGWRRRHPDVSRSSALDDVGVPVRTGLAGGRAVGRQRAAVRMPDRRGTREDALERPTSASRKRRLR